MAGRRCDYIYLHEPDHTLICSICFKLASDPWQHGGDGCGKLFCKECISNDQCRSFCPTCEMEDPRYNEDKRSNREIKALLVKCSYYDMKCDWVGTADALEKHINMCGLIEVPCPNECKDGKNTPHFTRKDLNEHLQQCPKRDYECEYCGEKGTYANISQDHDKVCEKKIVSCTNEECDMRMEHTKIKNHLANDCEHTVISCKYVSIGCDVKLKRKDMRAHEQDDKAHFKNLIDDVVKWKDKLKKKVAKLQVNTEEKADKLQDLTQGHLFYKYILIAFCLVVLLAIIFGGFAFSNLRKEKLDTQCVVCDDMESLKRSLGTTEDETQSFKEHVTKLENELARLESELKSTKITVASFNEKSHTTEVGVNATAHSLEKNITKLEDDMVSTKITVAFLKEKSHTTEVSVNDTIDKTRSLQDKVAKVEDEMASSNKRGSMTFKVTNYQKKKDNNVIFTSPPYYTSPNGYHMVIEVTASKGYVSVFVAIVKGNDELNWPFVGDVTIELLNQFEDKNHYTKVVYFTPKENVKVGSPAQGYYNYIPHSKLSHDSNSNTQYLKDDILYFRISVQVPDHKPWLECIVSLEGKVAKIEDEMASSRPMTFKVPKYQKKKDNNVIFASPPYYTRPNGYHMSMRVDANGYGDDEGSHVSVFVAIVKGKYDDELNRPFIGEVTIELLNQLKDNNHYTKVLFFTPKDNVNVGDNLGIQFIPHSKLSHDSNSNTQYLKEDTLYFRVSVKEYHHKPWLQTTDDILSLEDKMAKRGSMTFKLTEYKKKKDNNEIFTSPSFHTSPNGYHMAMRVDANGHGRGKGSHVSAYAYIIEGKYDNSLKWPFVGTITFQLLDQLEDRNHRYVILSITPEMNMTAGHQWGYPDFIAHSELQGSDEQYLKDDTMFFKLIVTAADYKPWLECTADTAC